MTKNKILLSLLFLMFISLIIRQINFSVSGKVVVFTGGGGRGGNVCYSTGATTQAECQSGQTGTGPSRSWRCRSQGQDLCVTPGVPCTQWEDYTWTAKECCQEDQCGVCTKFCDKEVTSQRCVSPGYRSEMTVPCGEKVTTCSCTECVAPTPCNRCLTNAPQQAVKSCQCLELKPKKDSANNLGFECLVKGSKDAKITDYTVTFKKPNSSLINLKSNKITETQCPASVIQDSTCYQVETTSIAATEKGKYEMVVPPLITCQ